MKIMHISDLHICHPSIAENVQVVFREATRRLGQEFSIGFANREQLEALCESVEELDPDAICITGDITTFGDLLSFDMAAEYIRRLRQRHSRKPRQIVVTPGNHDVLCSQLKALIERKKGLSRATRFLLDLFLRDVNKPLERLLSRGDVGANAGDPLAAFRKFRSDSNCQDGLVRIGPDQPEGNAPIIWCAPFNSVSLDPLWINIGETSVNAFRAFRDKLAEKKYDPGLVMALVHHNPVSAPDVVEPRIFNAYNSMPGASLFVHELQTSGADLILYGHQHEPACSLIDYIPAKPGYLFLVGAASGTTGENRGFNLLDFESRYSATLKHYSYDANTGALLEPSIRPLVFETERIDDPVTWCAQRELRHYRYREDGPSEEHEWSQMFFPGVKRLYMVGPRIKSLADEKRKQTIERILEQPISEYVRILTTDPAIFRLIRELPPDEQKRLSSMWGMEPSAWREHTNLAESTLENASKLYTLIPKPLWPKLEIRVSHTMLPIGGVLREPGEQRAKLLLRILAVGFGPNDFDRPLIRLEKRHNQAAYSYYEDYILRLWEKGTDVSPDLRQLAESAT